MDVISITMLYTVIFGINAESNIVLWYKICKHVSRNSWVATTTLVMDIAKKS